jgi:hypothetical protein
MEYVVSVDELNTVIANLKEIDDDLDYFNTLITAHTVATFLIVLLTMIFMVLEYNIYKFKKQRAYDKSINTGDKKCMA